MIQVCKDRFRGNKNRTFMVYDPTHLEDLSTAELCLSLDDIYHLVEDIVYKHVHTANFTQRYLGMRVRITEMI